MPLDGLSFSNSGLQRIITPTEIAAQTEQAAKVQAAEVIKKTDESKKTKTELDNEDQNKDLQGHDTGDEDENDSQEESQRLEDIIKFKNEANIKKYKVKFNQFTDMVELVDYNTGSVIETISPNDLISLISKSKGASGILVDKEI